jgi:hypothetical protein
MEKIDLKSVVIGSVWMTASGYPAIISDVDSSEVYGLVVSPGGPVKTSWDVDGKSQSNRPEFFDLKFAPGIFSGNYIGAKSGALVVTGPEYDRIKRDAELNDCDLFSKWSELKIEMF